MWSSPSDAELPWVQSAIEEGDPQPANQQEDEHERERKRKPGAEVDQFAVWKIAKKQRKCFKVLDSGSFNELWVFFFFIYVFSVPIRMRLGAVPVSVAVPPILAE